MSRREWYGFWVWDYLNHDWGYGKDLCAEAYKSYEIWREAYLKAYPEFSEIGDYELVTEHYGRWTNQLYDSWLFKAWVWFYKPWAAASEIIWHIKLKLF